MKLLQTTNYLNNNKLYPLKHLMFTAAILASIACDNKSDQRYTNIDEIAVLRIGLLPDQRRDLVMKKYNKLFERIEKDINIPFKIITFDTYDMLTEKFHNKEIDIAYFGGVTYLQAKKKSNALPLVMRAVDMNFTSTFITRNDTNKKNLLDFKGLTISFGAKLSTSGHILPRYFLEQKDIDPDSFFKKIIYSGSHDKTIQKILEGHADIGVVNSEILQSYFDRGLLKKHTLKILYETPIYPNYVWAIQPYLPKELTLEIQNSFTSLRETSKDDKEILKEAGTHHFVRAYEEDFVKLENILKQIKGIN